MTNGPTMTALGVGTVFVALSMLVGLVNLTSRVLRGGSRRRHSGASPRGAHPRGTTAAGRPRAAATPAIDKLRVALAAYGFHRRRCISVRGPEPPSAWLLAGRARQRQGPGGGN